MFLSSRQYFDLFKRNEPMEIKDQPPDADSESLKFVARPPQRRYRRERKESWEDSGVQNREKPLLTPDPSTLSESPASEVKDNVSQFNEVPSPMGSAPRRRSQRRKPFVGSTKQGEIPQAASPQDATGQVISQSGEASVSMVPVPPRRPSMGRSPSAGLNEQKEIAQRVSLTNEISSRVANFPETPSRKWQSPVMGNESMPPANDREAKYEALAEQAEIPLRRAKVGSDPGAESTTGFLGANSPFAHPAEEEFAHILNFYGVKWLYEPRSFPLRWDLLQCEHAQPNGEEADKE